jgi:GxxExxY protein
MKPGDLKHEELTHAILGAFFDVYNTLGFGFLEGLYVSALEGELCGRGYQVGREVHVPIMYKGTVLGRQRLDMLVEGKIVVEAKSTEQLSRHATRQLYSYLRASRLEVGLLLHFGPSPRFYRVFCANPTAHSLSNAVSG